MEYILALEKELAGVRASVTVLKTALVAQLNPDDPLEAAAALRKAEELVLNNDQNTKRLAQVEEVMEALKLWKKHGSPRQQS